MSEDNNNNVDAEIVAITSPPYRRALRKAGFGDQLDLLRNVEL